MFKNKNYVLAVYREGSFSKAADSLYISQPSLSASIKRIENKIGFPIFDRSATPVSVTEMGAEYIKYALEMENKEKDFEKYISDRSSLLTGTLKIGGSSLFTSYVIPKLISEFKKDHPDIRVEIFENNTHDLIGMLADGKIDIVIDNGTVKNDNINSFVLTSEVLLLAVPADFPVNQKLQSIRMKRGNIINGDYLTDKFGFASIKDFSDYPFVVLKGPNDTGLRAMSVFRKYKISPKIIFSVEQQLTAYNIACSGSGITFVSDTLIKRLKTQPMVYYYKLSDTELRRNIYYYMKKNRYVSKCSSAFIDSALRTSYRP